MNRQYAVTQRGDDLKKITEVKLTDPEEALGNFLSHLRSAGHDERKVEHFTRVWTVLLMRGAEGYTVLDPGLHGSVEIRIITT